MRRGHINFLKVSDYLKTHGKQPKGRGNWHFGLRIRPGMSIFQYNGTLGEAKKEFKKYIHKREEETGIIMNCYDAEVLG